MLIMLFAALFAKFCRGRSLESSGRANTYATNNANTRGNRDNRNIPAEPALALAVMVDSSAVEAGEVIPVARTVT